MMMMTKKNKLVYFGNERLVSGLKSVEPIILQGLIDRDYDVVAVVSHHNETRSRNARPLEVAEIAKEHNIPLFLPSKPDGIIDELRALQADAAVLAAYGRIISAEVIDIFPRGIINLHPSLLPAYRGPTPIESAIMSGDSETGVSLMKLGIGMDDGPVYAQKTIPLTGTETKYDLYEKAHRLGAELLLDSLPNILSGQLEPTPQNHDQATFSQLFTKSDGQLDPNKYTAAEAERRVRACLDYPKSRLEVFGQTVIIRQAHVVDGPTNDELVVEFKNHTYLAIDQLIAPSGKQISGRDFKRGYQKT